MSGRSAHVRKKKSDAKSSSHRPNTSANSSLHDNSSTDSPTPDYTRTLASPIPVGTGIGTTNARFLRFADSSVDVTYDGSGSSSSPGYHGADYSRRGTRMMGGDDYHGSGGGDWYGNMGPALRTEGVSGIEKSGLRSVIDRKSDGVRKGIAKTFTLGKKNKEDKGKAPAKSSSSKRSSDSSHGQRETFYIDADYDYAADPAPYQSPRTEQPMYGSPPQHAPAPSSPQHAHPGQFLADPWDAIAPVIPLPSPPPSRELPPLPPHARSQR